MTELPRELIDALPAGAAPVAERWWAGLSEAERRHVSGLWDRRLEVRFFRPQADESGRCDSWKDVPEVRGGRFVPAADDGRAEWQPGYFEHMLQHPELVLAHDPVHRTFHIGCTRHPAARACLEAGEVPAEFVCPFADADCPLRQLRGARLRGLAPG